MILNLKYSKMNPCGLVMEIVSRGCDYLFRIHKVNFVTEVTYKWYLDFFFWHFKHGNNSWQWLTHSYTEHAEGTITAAKGQEWNHNNYKTKITEQQKHWTVKKSNANKHRNGLFVNYCPISILVQNIMIREKNGALNLFFLSCHFSRFNSNWM